jgi:hypothetical protein
MKTSLALNALAVLVGACGSGGVGDGGDASSRASSGSDHEGSAPAEDPQPEGSGPAGRGGAAGTAARPAPGEADAGDTAVADSGRTAGCSGYRYCEDFESYQGPVADKATLGPWRATVDPTSTMTVDSSKPYRGAKSLHVTTPITAAAAWATLRQTAGGGIVPSNNLFGRMMVFYSSAPGFGLPAGSHSLLFNALATAAANVPQLNLGGGGGAGRTDFMFNYIPANFGPGHPEQYQLGPTTVAGVWHCLQWQYDGSGTPPKNEARAWTDGSLVLDAKPNKGWLFPKWERFEVGFSRNIKPLTATDIYIDDFALDETMIPCPP